MKKTIFFAAALLVSSVTFSQIKLSPTHLSIGGIAPKTNYYTTAHGSLFLAVDDTHANFLQFDVFNGRIAATANWLVLYNTQTSTFNDLALGTVYNYSDARAKTNIKNISYGLSTLNKLRPVSYNLVKNPSGNNNHTELGIIAQELEQIMPELVKTDNDGKKLVNYTGLIPVLIKSIQELQKEVSALKAAK